ncbi:MAG TPA: hypothetical protein VFR49_07300 [Solirubrobacteraceae bacterium]|nr:hypothetical protein [Solirubrobacteraceae bacterium]
MPNFNVVKSDRTITVPDTQYELLRNRLEIRAAGGDKRASEVLERLPGGPFEDVDWWAIYEAIEDWAADGGAAEPPGPELEDLRSDIALQLGLGGAAGVPDAQPDPSPPPRPELPIERYRDDDS